MNAHSSTTFENFLDKLVLVLWMLTSRFSQLIQASKQACVWVLVIVIMTNDLLFFSNGFNLFHEPGHFRVVIYAIGIHQGSLFSVIRFNHIQDGVI
jgi:hypothetical protein